MSYLPKLRVSKKRMDVFNVLSEIYINNSTVLIWQRDHKRKRFLNTAIISHLDKNGSSFYLESTSGEWLSEVRHDLPLYFKAEEQELLFKVQGIQLSTKYLVVPFPSDIRLIDKRRHTRIKPRENRNFIVHNSFKEGKRKQFSLKSIDISQSGAALLLTSNDSKFFYEGDTISISPSTLAGLGQGVEGKVLYMKSIDDIGPTFRGKELRLGVKFLTPLTSDQLSCFN